MDKEKEEKMKKAAEEACEQIRKEASKRVTDAIVDKVKTMNLDEDIHYAEFVKSNFEMMKELGVIGVVLGGVVPDNKDKSKVIYDGTLPFKFEVNDENGEPYTHFKVAQKAKKIITEYRRKVGPMVLGDTNPENFTFCYRMRDDVWTQERADHYTCLIQEEVDNAIKVLEELEKQKEKE